MLCAGWLRSGLGRWEPVAAMMRSIEPPLGEPPGEAAKGEDRGCNDA